MSPALPLHGKTPVLGWISRDATEAKAFAFAMIGRAEPLEAALMVRLSKIVDYLVDNLCLYILWRIEA
jgi:hypothetical protein